jgi:leucyl/phenylalanyl-tRNA--protein transferase
MPALLLPGDKGFPPLEYATEEGLLAVGGDVTCGRLVLAYRNGIFPWYDEPGLPLWWAPPVRCLLRPEEAHVPRSLRRAVNARRFSVTLDTAFPEVIANCAAMPREGQDGTWIVPEMVDAYTDLHRAGLAHSVEAWRNGALAGGLYGVSLGGAFFGESMFHLVPDASKVAFVWLARLLQARGFTLIDCQQVTDNLVRFGAYPATREYFMAALGEALAQPDRTGAWRMPEDFFPL